MVDTKDNSNENPKPHGRQNAARKTRFTTRTHTRHNCAKPTQHHTHSIPSVDGWMDTKGFVVVPIECIVHFSSSQIWSLSLSITMILYA